MRIAATALAALILAATGAASAQEATFQTRSLTPETALAAARAALESCRKQGFQVAVAVVDRAGLAQVVRATASPARIPWTWRWARPGRR